MQRRVLIVDDEDAIRLTMAAIFEINGFKALTASSAQEAIAAIGALSFDLIVTDLKMESETAGFSVAEFAAKRNPSPIVIMASAYPELAVDWEEHGVHAFFEKPTNTVVLLRSIAELLTRRQAAAA